MLLLDLTLVGEAHAVSRPTVADLSILILGVGNVLMGDEGVGVHAIRRLESEPEIPGFRLLDGGTGGVNLLAEFDHITSIILIDATRDGRPDGTIACLHPERFGDSPRGLGAHDFGLKDLFAATALIGRSPDLHLYTVSVSTIRPMCLDSPTRWPPRCCHSRGPCGSVRRSSAAPRKTPRTLPHRGQPIRSWRRLSPLTSRV